MTTPKARLTTGQPYTGQQMYAGNGVMRSCGKCGKHKPTAEFRKRAPWGMCCAACRGQQ